MSKIVFLALTAAFVATAGLSQASAATHRVAKSADAYAQGESITMMQEDALFTRALGSKW